MSLASDTTARLFPDVEEADIPEAERRLGVTFDEPRRKILLSNESFDVQACPGSGKTTVLVAKLAILAGKWPHVRRGICVLSHTNVARQEIERKLAGTAAGQRLLTYPHFVGTIHSFVNEFLALPLLRSEGRFVRLVDDEACFDWMKRRLTSWPTRGKLGNLAFKERSLDSHIWSLVCGGVLETLKAPQGTNNDQWTALVETKSKAIDKGIYYHADMFAAAERLLTEHPEVAEFARWRFPAVFIDEMQDTSELQGRLLAAIYPASLCGLRQRFGDFNQAIYDSGQAGATTDQFPCDRFRSLPNSQRFGTGIAAKAEPLAPIPTQPSLVGEGPRKDVFRVKVDLTTMPHTVFLFAADSAQQVLSAFGSLLLDTFPDAVLRSDAFVVRAIGRIGKPGVENGKVPRHLCDYWAGYEPRAAKLDPRPHVLVEYVHLGQRRRIAAVDCAEAVKTVAKGLAELVEILVPGTGPVGGQAVRWLWESVKDDEPAARALRSLLWGWCVELATVAEPDWPGQIDGLRRAIRPIVGGQWNQEADTFCRWSAELGGQSDSEGSPGHTTPNRYRFTDGKRFVDIDVGTIHSAKGQTHTATLVLETFYKKHDLADLLGWVVGDKRGAKSNEGVERLDRMRLVYTAMTRPTHLLCLAMRQEAVDNAKRLRLQTMGWRVRSL